MGTKVTFNVIGGGQANEARLYFYKTCLAGNQAKYCSGADDTSCAYETDFLKTAIANLEGTPAQQLLILLMI